MFELNNVENAVEIQLCIQGYQFPESPNDDWCLVKVVVKQGTLLFQAVDPALETHELIVLLEWFKCLAERKLPKYANLCFSEPCLEFQFLSCNKNWVRIAICLSHELKPPFRLHQLGFESQEWCVVFNLTPNLLDRVISGIESAILNFPIRGAFPLADG